MAVVWKLQRNNTRYEVRSAGRSLRLYTNGAFHTQFNPARALPGGVWDLLALPALAVPPKKALVLGVGGGAVLRLLGNFGVESITGVELDDVHLHVARRFFGCNSPDIELVHADAIRWVRQQRRRFDLVIDDLYLDGEQDPERPLALGSDWEAQLVQRVSARGVLVQNHLCIDEARRAARDRKIFRESFASALVFERPHYENAILALFRQALTARDARVAIRARIAPLGAAAMRGLDYRVKAVSTSRTH